MPHLIVRSDHARPAPPVAIADAVEQWARQNGRHATLRYSPELGAWTVNLSLKPNHPMLRAWQEGRLDEPEPPTEGVILHEWDANEGRYRALDLEEHGPTGIVGFLERGNMWSGRGEFDSLQGAVEAAASRAREEKDRIRRRQEEHVRDLMKDRRRSFFKIPFLRVGVDIPKGGKP